MSEENKVVLYVILGSILVTFYLLMALEYGIKNFYENAISNIQNNMEDKMLEIENTVHYYADEMSEKNAKLEKQIEYIDDLAYDLEWYSIDLNNENMMNMTYDLRSELYDLKQNLEKSNQNLYNNFYSAFDGYKNLDNIFSDY